ncbi:TPA: fimbrial biogenesis outer membrane usher protein [Serratia marcescens]|uniref:fimbrial biogenesis outer membrane usher protein n=1 Tax=Serratia marcescens TaxID=615 RepID=UPI00301E4B06
MRLSQIAWAVSLVCVSGMSHARSYTFDPAMLGEQGKHVDMTLFDQGVQLPGTYMVDVLLNGDRVDSRDVVFSLKKNAQGEPYLEPCLSVADLARYGVKVDDYPGLSATGECVRLAAIPQASSDFQFNNQQLLLSIPQVSLRPKLRGIAPQQLWDDGINALLLNYRANTSRTEYRNGMNRSTDSNYVQLNPGANLGPWRLRNQTNWQRQGDSGGKWQTVYTYAERGLNDIKSRLTLGERTTPGDIFDGVPFRGVMLGSDDDMVPYNQRAFAPVVRGIARTQARVEVKQNGYTLYNATVAPGPFALTDLSTSGSSSGDLQVTVWETDGTTQVFSVPYQTPAISLREGYLNYNLMAGQYRPADSGVDEKAVGQATMMYGLPWDLTVYAGFQGAEHFQAGSLGLGKSLGEWGAVSVDAIASHGQRRDRDAENGAAWRVRYSKEVVATNTTMTMTSYQYASSGYNTLSDVLDTWRSNDDRGGWWTSGSNDRRKSNTSIQLSQSLGPWGYLNLNGSRDDYWNRPGHDNTFGVSYGVSFSGVSLTLGWTQTKQVNRDGDQRTDRQTSLWVSVPLDRWLGGSTNATYQLTSPSRGGDTHEVGLNGQSFNRQLYWDVRQRYRAGDNNGGDRNSSAMRLSWTGGYGQIGGNYSYSPSLRQMGADVSGGLVVHRHGVTLGQTMGDTVALVEAPGASGVSVGGWPGVKTDFRGYTTQAYLTPYQENLVSLDPTNLPLDAEVPQTDMKVVPTKGAIVAAKFATRIGGRALMTLTRPGGQAVPFGALVTVEGQSVGAGVVGEGGQVYLTGLPEKGEMLVKWSEQQCRVSYHLPQEPGPTGVYTMTGVCH